MTFKMFNKTIFILLLNNILLFILIFFLIFKKIDFFNYFKFYFFITIICSYFIFKEKKVIKLLFFSNLVIFVFTIFIEYSYLINNVFFEKILFLLFVLFVFFSNKNKNISFKFNLEKKQIFKIGIYSILFICVFFVIKEFSVENLIGISILEITILTLLISVSEEILFLGFFYNNFKDKINKYSILVTCLYFSIFHIFFISQIYDFYKSIFTNPVLYLIGYFLALNFFMFFSIKIFENSKKKLKQTNKNFYFISNSILFHFIVDFVLINLIFIF
jgi:hypothetical protein